MSNTILIANAASSLFMTGLIWFVQIVHYPLLAQFGSSQSVDVALEHQRRTSWVVGAPMAIEGVTTLILLVNTPEGMSAFLPWTGAVLLAVALGSTVFLSVPLHSRMATSHSDAVGRKLVITNWPRTIAWTSRGALGIVMLQQVLTQ